MVALKKNMGDSILEFTNVYSLEETIVRKSLDDYFWPMTERVSARESLITANKKEAWFCDFLDSGLQLDITILISEADFELWSPHYQKHNSNTKKSVLTYHQIFTFAHKAPLLAFEHKNELAEPVRKKIYVSDRFKGSADQIWAAQYFDPQKSNRAYMRYALGFNRDIVDLDRKILSEIKNDISEFTGKY